LLEGITFILDAHGFELHKKVTSPRISVLLCGPWGCFDVLEVVVEFVDDSDESRKVSEVQLWGQQLQTPNASPSGTRSCGSEYLPCLLSLCCESSEVDKLERLILTPQTNKEVVS
jgi:hypothetical protein